MSNSTTIAHLIVRCLENEGTEAHCQHPRRGEHAVGQRRHASQGKRIKINHGKAPTSARFADWHFPWVFDMRIMRPFGKGILPQPTFGVRRLPHSSDHCVLRIQKTPQNPGFYAQVTTRLAVHVDFDAFALHASEDVIPLGANGWYDGASFSAAIP